MNFAFQPKNAGTPPFTIYKYHGYCKGKGLFAATFNQACASNYPKGKGTSGTEKNMKDCAHDPNCAWEGSIPTLLKASCEAKNGTFDEDYKNKDNYICYGWSNTSQNTSCEKKTMNTLQPLRTTSSS